MNIHEVTKYNKYARESWNNSRYMSSIPTHDVFGSRYFLPTMFWDDDDVFGNSLYYLTIEDVEANDWFIVEI